VPLLPRCCTVATVDMLLIGCCWCYPLSGWSEQIGVKPSTSDHIFQSVESTAAVSHMQVNPRFDDGCLPTSETVDVLEATSVCSTFGSLLTQHVDVNAAQVDV
jgi:hypothetical protein